jgi:hypothetical protein
MMSFGYQIIVESTLDTGKLGVWYFFDGLTSSEAAKTAQRIESLGFGTLWIPETVGKSPVVMASWLLGNTQKLNVATGIMNIYHREPGVTMAAQKSLAEQADGRFLLGHTNPWSKACVALNMVHRSQRCETTYKAWPRHPTQVLSLLSPLPR